MKLPAEALVIGFLASPLALYWYLMGLLPLPPPGVTALPHAGGGGRGIGLGQLHHSIQRDSEKEARPRRALHA